MALHQVSTTPDLSTLKIERQPPRAVRGRWLRWLMLSFVILLVGAGMVFALWPSAPIVSVASVRKLTAEKTALLNASGYVTPRRRATIAAKITGLVSHIFVEEGMLVREGQILATLDSSDARVRVVSAEAMHTAASAALGELEVNLVNAERELRRAEELQQEGVSSQQVLDLARNTADSLRARIVLTRDQILAASANTKVMQQDLENTVVRAPFAGLVVSKDAQVGEMVSPISAGGGFTRTGIATIVDMKSLEIEVDVNEAYITRVVPGHAVTAILDAYPDWQIPSAVRIIIPTADRQKATVKVRVSFDQLDPRILADMGVKVTFLGDRQTDQNGQILVPTLAIQQESGQQIVYVYRDGRTERRAISVGKIHGDDREVTAGLTAGDQVVLQGLKGLRDGMAVQVQK